ncbi:MAG: IS21 family transposase, partial [Candidatus Omnitrophica bacterium]|nr:IS21 family transposase [Candidatus Omnitrophota bacterium]
MRTTREVLRIGFTTALSFRDIGRSLHLSHPTVQKYIQTAKAKGLTWDQVQGMSDAELSEIMTTAMPSPAQDQRPEPDCTYIHQEMKKKSVTLTLLWQEYKEVHPDGYQLTKFRQFYRKFAKKIRLSLRQVYKFGSTMFVDYAGHTIPIYDRVTGAVSQAQIFVAVLGASNYAYAEATPDQSMASWIGSHVRTFEYFRGVTEKIICDNLKAGVTSPCRYEPDINLTYADLAAHYGTVILPTRVYQPRDKGKVESCVLIVERWILAALRNRKFFSLGELNEAIRELLIKFNQKPMQKLEGSRESVFKTFEQSELKSLPEQRYEYAEWKKAKVNIDYHIEFDDYYYSVPHNLVHEPVEVRATATIIEILYNNRRIASHVRGHGRERYITIHEHMPRNHQEFLEWTPAKMISCAQAIGPKTTEFIKAVLESRKYPELGYRTCLGVIRLAKAFGKDRMEAACQRAIVIGALSYKSINMILKNNMDRRPLTVAKTLPAIQHDNIRGGEYF